MKALAQPRLRLKYLCEVNPPPPRVPDSQDVTFVPMEALHERGGISADLSRAAGALKQGYTGFIDGDVVVARITPCFENGKASLVAGMLGGIGFGTTELHVLRARCTEPRWLFYLIQSAPFMGFGEGAMYGAGGQKRVPPDFIRNFRAWAPPHKTQVAVADYLDRKTAAIDALIEKKQKLMDLLTEKRAALINQAVTKGLDPNVPMKDSGIPWIGAIPVHWNIRRLKFLCKLETGHTPSRSEPSYWIESECRIPWVSLNDTKTLEHFDYIESTRKLISPLGMANSAAHLIPAGAVVFNRDGARVGLAAITTRPMAVSQHIIAWVCGPLVDNRYLLQVLYAMKRELHRITAGATIPTIGMTDVGRMTTPLPPAEEQQAITSHLAESLRALDRAESTARTQLDRLREYRQALITAAVTGQLPIPEAPTS